MKSRRMRRAAVVATREEIKNMQKILARKPEWKKPFGRLRFNEYVHKEKMDPKQMNL